MYEFCVMRFSTFVAVAIATRALQGLAVHARLHHARCPRGRSGGDVAVRRVRPCFAAREHVLALGMLGSSVFACGLERVHSNTGDVSAVLLLQRDKAVRLDPCITLCRAGTLPKLWGTLFC